MLNNDIDAKDWIVLIVDDDPDNLSVAEKVLTFYGAKVHTAVDGRKGLEILKQLVKPTLILLDLSMPDMDGWEMMAALQKMPEKSTLPVIAVTAHAMPKDKERALSAGFDGYIIKPFMLHTFMDEIAKCLKRTEKMKMGELQGD